MRYTDSYLSSLDAVLSNPQIERLEGKRVLVTGCTGLIGSCFSDALINLAQTHGWDLGVLLAGRSEERVRSRFSHWRGGYEFLRFDALDQSPLEVSCDYIVHCASNAHPIAYATKPVETMLGNVLGTRRLLDCAVANRARLLYVSSSEVYGEKEGSDPYEEREYGFVDILDPRSCYPTSKRFAESLCASYRDEYGADFVVARPGHVYGPTCTESDSRAHAQFARLARKGQDIVLKSEGNQLRSYCYVVDCVTAMLSIMLQGRSGEAYNVSNPDSLVTIRQLAQAFADAAGSSLVFDLPSELERKGANRMSNSALSSERLEALGWKGAFGAAEGVRLTIDAVD